MPPMAEHRPTSDHPTPPAELRSLLHSLSAPAILLSPDYRIVAANAAYEATHGRQIQLGRDRCYAVSHHYDAPCDQRGERCPLQRALETGRRARALHVHHSAQGREHVDVEMTPIRGEDGEIRFFLERMRPLDSSGAEATDTPALLGQGQPFMDMLNLMQRVAPTDVPVVLLGASGTGKEVVARAIHQDSKRASKPFVPVECSGLAEGLFESELFGHERGAFTGAHAEKLGLVEVAEGGTLFLDEIGDVPLALQVKLLRLLESSSYRRVGGVEVRRANFRLMCATHRDLKGMVAEGTFRRDLYYRISAFPIPLPPLRARPGDLPLLVSALLKQLGSHHTLSAAALARLQRHDFPGNIRELRNVLQRATLLADGPEILPRHLPADLSEGITQPEAGPPRWCEATLVPLDTLERRYLRWAEAQHDGDRHSLAHALGVSERTLFRKLKRSR